ncbi:hypothetical protein C8J57DRAFT_1294839 [Mycena rebaudengoi]|nr:hypothetical protein C8J57DRAFT_1294839 [Mycena rebaudengoi]
MQLTLLFATLTAAGVCAAAPFIQEQCDFNATTISGADDHELRVTTSSCWEQRPGSTSHSELSKRATCVPDLSQCHVGLCNPFELAPPKFASDCNQLLASLTNLAPTFSVAAGQAIPITFRTCVLNFAVGPQTSGICGANWASVGASILSGCLPRAGGQASCGASSEYLITLFPNE